jgi:hypothetical protein
MEQGTGSYEPGAGSSVQGVGNRQSVSPKARAVGSLQFEFQPKTTKY